MQPQKQKQNPERLKGIYTKLLSSSKEDFGEYFQFLYSSIINILYFINEMYYL